MRDDRPLKLLKRTPVEGGHVGRLIELAEAADTLAVAANKELQFEAGKEHVALIVGCNQFVRFYRAGSHAGVVELWLEPGPLAELEAVADVGAAVGGAVFQMFGWRTVDPRAEGVDAALSSAFARAAAAPKPSF